MAGLQLGSLYVSLSANSMGLVRGLDGAMKAVDRFAKEVKKTSEDAAKVAATFTVLSGAALKLASGVDGPTKRAMDDMTKSTQLLAVQVADMLLPAVRQVTAMFKSAAEVVASLNPETKAAISNFALVAVQVMAAGKALAVLASTVGPVISLMRGTLSVITALGSGPLLGVVAAIGLVVAIVVLLHRAWRKNWGGIQESTAEVLEWLRSGFSQLVDFFRKAWDSILSGGERFVMGLLDIVDTVQRVTGTSLVDTAGAREGFKGLFKDLRSGAFVSEAFKFGKSVGASVVDGLKEELAAISKELGLDALLAKLKGGSSKGKVIGLGRGMPGGGTLPDQMAIEQRKVIDTGAFKVLEMGNLTRSTGMSVATGAAERKEANALAAAIGADSWADATKEIQGGLGAAATLGHSLKVWAARMGPMIAQMGQQLLGEVGNLVSTIAQGAQAGGVWGALLAAIMEIAKKTESAMRFLDVAMEFVMQLAAMVEPLVKPIFDALTNVLGIVIEVVAPVFAALEPLFQGIGRFVDNLAPILYAVGDVLAGLSPIIEFIGNVVGGILDALKPILDIVAGAVKLIATVLLGIIIFLNEVAAAFGDTKARAEADRLKGVVDRMWKRDDETARANGKAAGSALSLAAANKQAADSAKEVTESLTNLPSGFKLNALRFAADTGMGGLAAGGPGSGSGGVYVENMYVQASDPEELAEQVENAQKRKAAARTGNRHGDDEGI